jgi:hypothetical protein
MSRGGSTSKSMMPVLKKWRMFYEKVVMFTVSQSLEVLLSRRLIKNERKFFSADAVRRPIP